jgi:predicted TIM-barrel fold metal-dependent hydrolase
MPTIDSHVHVWASEDAAGWPAGPASPPRHDASPDTLLASMRLAGVEAAVLVQYIGYRWNNDYVARVLADYPERFVGVCRVDPEDPAAPDHLSYWTECCGFHGVRISPDAGAAGDWFKGPLMRPFFRRAADLKVPVLLLTGPSRLRELLATLEQVSDVDVVVDHFADCDAGNAEHRQLLMELARNPRVFLKTGHLWAGSSEGYPWRDKHALFKLGCELFGTDRIMWGSDWSFCLRHATYQQALSYVRDEMRFLTRHDLDFILGGTSQRLWTFPRFIGSLELDGADGATPSMMKAQ